MARGGTAGLIALLTVLLVGVWILDTLPTSDAPSPSGVISDGEYFTLATTNELGTLGTRLGPNPNPTLHSLSTQAHDAVTYDGTNLAMSERPRRIETATVAPPPRHYTNAAVDHASGAPRDELTVLLESVQENGMVVATTTDNGYLDLTINWVCHLKTLHLEGKVIVFALDEEIHKEMSARGIPSYYEKGMTKSSDKVGNWNSKTYNQVVHTKTKHQVAVLERGYNLLFADVDIPWTSDMRAQVVAEADGVDFLGQQNWPQNDMNTGFMFVRSNEHTLHFFRSVLALEHRLESGEIKIGADPRHDIFNPSDDQSSIAFTLLCGRPTGQYPGRGDDGFPRGGPVPPSMNIVVQSKWQKGELMRRHALRPGQVKTTEHRRTFMADCLTTSSVNITYALLPPKYYQTGHKAFAGLKYDAILAINKTTMYHPNFMKGSDTKVVALQRYGRWKVAPNANQKQTLECL